MKYELQKTKTGKELGINQKNIDIYIKYLQSCFIKSLDTMSTTALGHHKDTKVTRQHYMRKKKLSEMRATLLQIRSLAGL